MERLASVSIAAAHVRITAASVSGFEQEEIHENQSIGTTMTLKDILEQLLERGMAMQTYWGFYITVSLGLVAFFGSAKQTSRLPYVAALATVVFIAFAYVNCSGMTAISTQRCFLYQVLSSIGPSTVPAPSALDLQVARGFLDIAKPDAPGAVRNFHIASDLAVLGAIWFLTLFGKVAKNNLGESQENP